MRLGTTPRSVRPTTGTAMRVWIRIWVVAVPVVSPISRTLLAIFSGTFLVDVPAGIDIADAEGRTPLFAAAAAGRRETVELLLDHGANPNSSRMNGESPLFVAVENRHIEVVRTLLKMGALPTVVDSRGRTPLQVARAQDNKEMAALLLTFRAQMPDKNTRATTHPRPDASPK